MRRKKFSTPSSCWLKSMELFTSVFMRFWWAAVILLIVLRLRTHRLPQPSPRETVLVIGLGLLGITLYNSLFSAGLTLVEASRAALIVPTNPAFTALFRGSSGPRPSRLALSYLIVFGTVLPFLWFYEGVKALGAARVGQFINLVPPLAVAESVLILGRPLPHQPAPLAGAAYGPQG
jgi:drug/metabolite transporter (DMT)-like permease